MYRITAITFHSDSYSDHTNNTQRHLLKRRVPKKKSSHQGSTSTRTTNADADGANDIDDGLLESGQMSLRSEDPAVTAALERYF